MAVSTEQIKELRERTGAGPLDCKKVLEQANGNMDIALDLLRERGMAIAGKKVDRPTTEGRIETYTHSGNKIVALVELNCETDFVGRNEAFVQLAKDIALHIAAMNPKYLNREEVPQSELESKDVSSPEKFYEEHVLLDQPFVKQPGVTIGDKVRETIAKTKENIVVRRYVRYEVGG